MRWRWFSGTVALADGESALCAGLATLTTRTGGLVLMSFPVHLSCWHLTRVSMASALDGLLSDFVWVVWLAFGPFIVLVVRLAFGPPNLSCGCFWPLVLGMMSGFLLPGPLPFSWSCGAVFLELWSCGVGVGTAALLPFEIFLALQVQPRRQEYAEVSCRPMLCIGVTHFCMHAWCLLCEIFGRCSLWLLMPWDAPLGAIFLCFGIVHMRTHALQRGGWCWARELHTACILLIYSCLSYYFRYIFLYISLLLCLGLVMWVCKLVNVTAWAIVHSYRMFM